MISIAIMLFNTRKGRLPNNSQPSPNLKRRKLSYIVHIYSARRIVFYLVIHTLIVYIKQQTYAAKQLSGITPDVDNYKLLPSGEKIRQELSLVINF